MCRQWVLEWGEERKHEQWLGVPRDTLYFMFWRSRNMNEVGPVWDNRYRVMREARPIGWARCTGILRCVRDCIFIIKSPGIRQYSKFAL